MEERIAAPEEKNPLTAYIDGFKKMFIYHGRSSKYDYWSFVLINSMVSMILAIILGALFSPEAKIATSLKYTYNLVSMLAVLALSVRRLHDVGRTMFMLVGYITSLVIVVASMLTPYSAIIIICFLICLAFSISLIVLLLTKGEADENRYGAPVIEKANSNLLGTIFFLLNITLSVIYIVAGGMLSFYMAGTNESSADSENNSAVVSEAEYSDTEQNAEDEPQPIAPRQSQAPVEAPSVPMHETGEE